MKKLIKSAAWLLVIGSFFFFGCENVTNLLDRLGIDNGSNTIDESGNDSGSGTNPSDGTGGDDGIFHGNESPAADTGTHVYIYGNYDDGTNWFAYYWKDGVRSPLPVAGAMETSVHGVAEAADGTRYEAGEYWDNTYIDKACYWTDEANCRVIANGSAIAITTNAGIVYVLGHSYDKDSNNNYQYWYWKSGTGKSTPLVLSSSSVPNESGIRYYPQSIAAYGNNVYVVGYYVHSAMPGSERTACYWDTYGNCCDLGDNACAYDAVFQNGQLYIAGGYNEGYNYYFGEDTVWMGCYWGGPNLKWIAFTNGADTTSMARASSITTDNRLLYLGGYYVHTDGSRNACYWQVDVNNLVYVNAKGTKTNQKENNIEGDRTDLPGMSTDTDAFVHDIAVSGGEVYAVGEYYPSVAGYADEEDYYNEEQIDPNAAGKVCYWTDGVIHKLDDATEVCGIEVVTH